VSLPDRIVVNDFTESLKLNQEVHLTNSNAVKGLPCSGGLIEAYCEVVTDLSLAPSLKDKILIADRTDPAWGYFFVGVKGIIIEKGSMLSHAAIISRELGIPCIINVKNATQKFSSGMKLRMNGDTGEIEIL
jgi:pyruvate,water dikinase